MYHGTKDITDFLPNTDKMFNVSQYYQERNSANFSENMKLPKPMTEI